MLNRMLLVENPYLKFRIINSRSRQWIHEINTQRGIHGEFHHLYRELRGHPQRFFEYTRMSIGSFDILLSKLGTSSEQGNYKLEKAYFTNRTTCCNFKVSKINHYNLFL
jgi:hypothetical protein